MIVERDAYAPGGAEALAFTVLWGRDAPEAGRREIAGRVAPWLPAYRAFALKLLTTEVVTNAVQHGVAAPDAAIRVEVVVECSRVRVEVTNTGPAVTACAAVPAVTSTTGRGLLLVDALADSWGVRHEVGQTTVWFEIPVAA